mgnify:CR=1 FL=1
MSLYVIGDLHLSFGTDKPMDIFSGWTNYVERLEENWQNKVKPEDTVVIAGDISWGMTMEEALEDFRFIDRLNGNKIILKGNHDYWFSTKSKVENALYQHGLSTIRILFNNAYEYDNCVICGTRGWINEPGAAADKKVMLREAGRLRLSLEAGRSIGKPPVVFLHYPPVSANAHSEELLEVMQEYGVTTCYYGHLHGYTHRRAFEGMREKTEYALIAADYVAFQPVKICN